MMDPDAMQLALHLGAHCTDEDRLLRSLLRNRAELGARGIAVPGPGKFRDILREAMGSLRGAPASAETQEMLLDAMLDDGAPARLVLSWESFLCMPPRAVDGASLYPMAGRKARWLAALFPQAEVELFLALRNPAGLIPALAARMPEGPRGDLLETVAPRGLSWVPMIEALRAALPDAALTVWCDEDSALIWPELMAAMAGLPIPEQGGPALEGTMDRLRDLMTPAGADQLQRWLDGTPPATALLRQRTVAAFLDKFADPAASELELDLPGWDDTLVTALSAAYDADCAEIAAMDGVRFLTALATPVDGAD